MKKIVVLILTVISLVTIPLQAQDSIPEVKVIYRVSNGKVMLRWGVSDPITWKKANAHGYSIERFTVKRNGQHIAEPEKKLITPTPILPAPLETWEQIIHNNDYAAIMAQALYGKKFEVEGMQQGGITQIINKIKEAEQRFSFALLAADMNFEVAVKAGLGFVDADIKEGEIYFYKIKTAIPEETLMVKTGTVYVDPGKEEELPKPIGLTAVPQDKSVLLVWDYEILKAIFNNYHIERSENGTDFKRLGGAPLVNMDDGTTEKNTIRRMYYTDTLSQNDKTYQYRVIGISPFGEQGPPSEVVTTEGVKTLEALPHIAKTTFDASGAIQLHWEFDKKAEPEITGFELNWAPKQKGPYTVVQTDIPSHTRQTTFREVAPSNYFTITALGKNNQKKTSFSAFVQTEDSIPPAAPKGLKATIDSLGIVKMKWQANTERDMLGYRVYKGNLEKEEPVQITVSPIVENTFVDTVQVKSLNKKVFYQVIAVDTRYNMSEISEKLMLKKPDVVPPSSPIFSTYKVKEDGVNLYWINSSSTDVIAHQLYRQNTAEAGKGWELIFKTDTITKYIDVNATSGLRYRYAIFAEDEAGLRSAPSTPLTITMQRNVPQHVIKSFKGVVDRLVEKIDLSWKITNENISEVLIYKNKKNEVPTLWKELPATIKKSTDTHVSPNTDYTYQIKAILKNGAYSTVETVNITY